MRWRVLGHKRKPSWSPGIDERFEPRDQVEFDELVVGDWLHIEQLDSRVWWMRVGDARIDVTIPAEGPVEVRVMRGEY